MKYLYIAAILVLLLAFAAQEQPIKQPVKLPKDPIKVNPVPIQPIKVRPPLKIIEPVVKPPIIPRPPPIMDEM